MDIMEKIAQMSEEEQAQLLAIDLGEELEKEAAAELAQAELAEALYAYGALIADSEVESYGDLSKEAAAELDQAELEIAFMIEDAMVNSGILDTEDTVELHKEAQAAAGLIFQGYADQIEKVANDESKTEKLKKWISGAKAKAKEHGAKAVEHMKAHKGKYMLGAGAAAAGLGALAYKKHHEKKASEVSASEMAQIIMEEQAVDAVVIDGLNKLASTGAAVKESLLSKAKEAVKANMKKHPGKYMIGAHAGALAANTAANRMQGKGWRQSLTSSALAPNYQEVKKKDKE